MSNRDNHFIRTRKRWLHDDWEAYYPLFSDIRAYGNTESSAVENLIHSLDGNKSLMDLGISNCKAWLNDRKVK